MHVLFFCLAIALIALVSPARAEAIQLLCGFDTVIVDTDQKSVTVKHVYKPGTLDAATDTFKDGHKYQNYTYTVSQFVRISEATVDFWEALDGVTSTIYRIDRRTGIYAGPGPGPGAAVCALMPAKPVF